MLIGKSKFETWLVFILIISLGLNSVYFNSFNYFEIVNSGSAARTVPAENFEFIHGFRLNGSIEYWGLVTSDLVVGVAVGNENVSFPLSVFIVQKQSIGMVEIIDANGKEHIAPLLIYQFIMVSFNAVGFSNYSLIGENGQLNSSGIVISSLLKTHWNISLSQDARDSKGGSFTLEAKTITGMGEIGFRFWLNYSKIIKKNVNYLLVKGNLREGAKSIVINKTSSLQVLRSVSLKIDQFMNLEKKVFRSFLLFDAKAVTMLSPALKRLLIAKNDSFEAFIKNTYPTNETITDVREPIIFYGPGGMAAKFGWTKTVEVDDKVTQTRAVIRSIERKYMSLIWSGKKIEGRGIMLSGGFVYPEGKKIFHDPDILTESRINPQNLTIVSYLEPQVKGLITGIIFMTLVFGIVLTYHSTKKAKIKQ